MKTIQKENFTSLGTIQKPHGLRGELMLSIDPTFESAIEEAEVLFIEIDGGLVPFFISEDGVRFKNNESIIVQFDEITNQEKARELSGCQVYLPNDQISEMSPDQEISYLVNFTVIDTKWGELGKISTIDDYAGNLVATVPYKKTEVLIPLSDSIITEINEETTTLYIDCPDGLLDLYLE